MRFWRLSLTQSERLYFVFTASSPFPSALAFITVNFIRPISQASLLFANWIFFSPQLFLSPAFVAVALFPQSESFDLLHIDFNTVSLLPLLAILFGFFCWFFFIHMVMNFLKIHQKHGNPATENLRKHFSLNTFLS